MVAKVGLARRQARARLTRSKDLVTGCAPTASHYGQAINCFLAHTCLPFASGLPLGKGRTARALTGD